MFRESEGHIMGDEQREPTMNPAQSETPLVSGSSKPDRLEKATSYQSSRNASGESDDQVLPAKHSNKEEQSLAESVEGSCAGCGRSDMAAV